MDESGAARSPDVEAGSQLQSAELERDWAARRLELSRDLDVSIQQAISGILSAAAETRQGMEAEAKLILDRLRHERARLIEDIRDYRRQREGLAGEIAETRRRAEEDAVRIRRAAENERSQMLAGAETRRTELMAEIQRLEEQLADVSSGIQSLLQEQIGRVRGELSGPARPRPAPRAAEPTYPAEPAPPPPRPDPAAVAAAGLASVGTAADVAPPAPPPPAEPPATARPAGGPAPTAPSASAQPAPPTTGAGRRGDDSGMAEAADAATEDARTTPGPNPGPARPAPDPVTPEPVARPRRAEREVAPPPGAPPSPADVEYVRAEQPAGRGRRAVEPAPATPSVIADVAPAAPHPEGTRPPPPPPTGATGYTPSGAPTEPSPAVLGRIEVAVTNTPSFARALEFQRGVQRTEGVRQVQALQFEHGTLVLAVEHDPGLDVAAAVAAIPSLGLELVRRSADRLEFSFPDG